MLRLSLKNLIKNLNPIKNSIVTNKISSKKAILQYDFFFFNNVLKYYALGFNIYLFFNFFSGLKSKKFLNRNKNSVSFFTILDKNSFLWDNDIRLKNELELVVGPFNKDSALLIGQQLRHILLSNLGSYRISKMRIKHEDLVLLNSLDLDFSEFLLNLTNLIFYIPSDIKNLVKNENSILNIHNFKKSFIIKFKGPGIITASNIFDLPDSIKILNKNHFLCLSSHPINLDLKFDLTYNTDLIKEKSEKNIVFDDINNEYLISLSPTYNPVLMVNFEIEQRYWLEPIINEYKKSDFIKFKIKTNGSISALESLYYSCCFYLASFKL